MNEAERAWRAASSPHAAAIDQVRGAIDPARLFTLLEDAVGIYSPSFAEHAVTDLFAAALDAAGIPVERQRVGTPQKGRARENLIIRLGPQPPSVLWNGHVDTVHLRDHESLEVTREGELLYGLGTADMKGACVAVVEALRALAQSGLVDRLERGLAVALVVGEEHDGDGSRALPGDLAAPLTLIGEPTGLRPCLEHHGYLELALESRGRRAHAALPEVGASAIHAMLAWLTRLSEAIPAGTDANEIVAFNPRTIEGGSGLFAVADGCRAEVDIHLPANLHPDQIREAVERTRLATLENHPACTLAVEETLWAPGYGVSADSPVLAPLRLAFEAIGRTFEPAVFRSHSDAGILLEHGARAVICGPGQLEVAHTAEEHVALSEVLEAAHLYAAVFASLCAT